MANQEGTASFEAMIHADRARKKNEDLANQIFGRSKSSQNVNKKQKQQEPRSPSLASRMGVQKRSSSSSVPTQNKNPFQPPSRPSSTTPNHRNQHNNNAARANRIATEINSGNANISAPNSRNSSFRNDRNGEPQSQTQQGAGQGLSIKGSAGPFTLLASNFDPGTTEADIEAALYSELFDDKGNNTLTSCRILSTRPTVVAEMVLTEKSVADKIIRKFHNLKADGRILKVVLQKSGTESFSSRRKDTSRGGSAVVQTIEQPEVTEGVDVNVGADGGDMDMDDVEAPKAYPATSSYDHEREAADRDRRDRDRNRDREDYAASGTRRDDRRDTDRTRDDRDRRRGGDDRDQEDDRDRGHDRERERDWDRDRGRSSRDTNRDPAQSSRDRDREYDSRNTYDSRPTQPRPPQAYGNGFGRPPRGAYGGGGGGYGGRGGYGFQRGGGGGYGGRGGYRGY